MVKTKTPALIAALTLSAAALAGCSTGEAPGAAPVTEAPAAATSPAPEPEVTPEPSPEPEAVITDPAEAKAAALEDGRPEAAWDLHCVAWNVDGPEGGGDGPAHELANAWLDAHDADCPDAIVHPGYYAQSFENGAPGEVIITLEDAALEDYFVHPGADTGSPQADIGLKTFGHDLLHIALEGGVALEAVTVTVEGTDRAYTATPESYIEYRHDLKLPAPSPEPAG